MTENIASDNVAIQKGFFDLHKKLYSAFIYYDNFTTDEHCLALYS